MVAVLIAGGVWWLSRGADDTGASGEGPVEITELWTSRVGALRVLEPTDRVDLAGVGGGVAVFTALLRWPGGSHRWRWSGDVPADSCVRIGTIQFVVPDAPGGLWLDLVLEHGDEVASNRYEAIVSR